MEKLKNTKSRSKNMKQKKLVYDNGLDIFNQLLNDYVPQYAKFSDEKIENTDIKIYFLKGAAIINGSIFKIMKNQLMKNQIIH